MTGTPLRVAVVGTAFGGRVHVPALRAAGFDVVALVGRDRERTVARAAQLGVPLGATSLDEVLAHGPLDAVTVATPPDAHVAPTLEAIDRGLAVLCEKPLASTSAEAVRLRDAARAAGVVNVLGFEFRWNSHEAALARLVASGRIGRPRFASHAQFSSLVAAGRHQAFNDDWWFDESRGGGILNAGGSHVIDRFRTWVGEIEAVSGSVHVSRRDVLGGADDTYVAVLRTTDGVLVNMQQCSAAWGPPMAITRVVGDAGSCWLEGERVVVADRDGVQPVEIPDDLVLPEPPPRLDDPREIFTRMELPPFTRLAERFRDAIVAGDPSYSPPGTPVTPTFADGARAQLVIDAIRAGHQHWVQLPPA
jgi:predicted dehydrogenase